jgi:uncharacterized repeat protein (TIGR01451 family)/fimbrial isopeptide formation D2 family protein
LLATAFIKALADTNWAFTIGSDVTIGEIVSYEVTLHIPPGAAEAAVLSDTLEAGLAFVDCVSITPASGDLTTDLVGGFDEACTNPTVEAEPGGDLEEINQGRKVTYDLGNLTNTAAGSVELQLLYRVVVLDNIENQDGEERNNQVEWEYGGMTLNTSADPVVIVEPDMQISKSVNTSTVSNGQTVTFTIRVSHTGDSHADAFDLELTDVLPDNLEYVAGSLVQVSGTAATTLDDSDPASLGIYWDEFLLGGETAVFRFDAVVTSLGVGSSTTNSAYLAWTSLPGDYVSTQSLHNTLSTERFYDPPSDVNIYGTSDSVTLQYPRPTAIPTAIPTPTLPSSK